MVSIQYPFQKLEKIIYFFFWKQTSITLMLININAQKVTSPYYLDISFLSTDSNLIKLYPGEHTYPVILKFRWILLIIDL